MSLDGVSVPALPDFQLQDHLQIVASDITITVTYCISRSHSVVVVLVWRSVGLWMEARKDFVV